MSIINLQNIRQAEGLMEDLHEVRTKIEQRINLEKYSTSQKALILTGNKIMRICLCRSVEQRTSRIGSH